MNVDRLDRGIWYRKLRETCNFSHDLGNDYELLGNGSKVARGLAVAAPRVELRFGIEAPTYAANRRDMDTED
ncbi:MAG: hypothetical protein ACK56N_01050 [Betaproteobacteria bacterium]